MTTDLVDRMIAARFQAMDDRMREYLAGILPLADLLAFMKTSDDRLSKFAAAELLAGKENGAPPSEHSSQRT